MIHFLVYTSKAAAPIDQAQLDDIALSSKEKNKRLNITGMLLSIDGYFIQYLEGPKENIDTLIGSIKKDERHTDIDIRTKGNTDRRIFREWSMGSWLMPRRQFIELSGLYDIKQFLANPKGQPVESLVYIDLFNDILLSWIRSLPSHSEKLKSA